MVACSSRSGLIVKLETPMSYLPLWTPRMIASKAEGTHSVLTPNFAMTASKRSTSMPMTVLPSVSRYSLGWYVASVPTTMVPALLIFSGSFATSAWSGPEAEAEAVGAALVVAPTSDSESEPHALRASAVVAAAATARARVGDMGAFLSRGGRGLPARGTGRSCHRGDATVVTGGHDLSCGMIRASRPPPHSVIARDAPPSDRARTGSPPYVGRPLVPPKEPAPWRRHPQAPPSTRTARSFGPTRVARSGSAPRSRCVTRG